MSRWRYAGNLPGHDRVDLSAAVRWWRLREIPRVGDVDFAEDRLVARTNEDLANGLGNLVNRVVTVVHRYRGGRVPDGGPDRGAYDLLAVCGGTAERVDGALGAFDYRRATGAVWQIVAEANRYVELALFPGITR